MLPIGDNLRHWKASGTSDLHSGNLLKTCAIRPLEHESERERRNLIVEWNTSPITVMFRKYAQVPVEQAAESADKLWGQAWRGWHRGGDRDGTQSAMRPGEGRL